MSLTLLVALTTEYIFQNEIQSDTQSEAQSEAANNGSQTESDLLKFEVQSHNFMSFGKELSLKVSFSKDSLHDSNDSEGSQIELVESCALE